MSTPAKRLPSVYEQFLQQPPNVEAEIINGVLTTQPRPAARPARAAPTAQTLEIFRLDGARWSLLGTHRDDAVVRAEPFAAIELELTALWAR